MRPHPLLAALVAAPLLLTAAGCGRSVSKAEFKETLVKDAKLAEGVADCVTEELFRKLDETQIEHVYTGERADLTATERQAVADAAVLCVSGAKSPTTGK